MGWFSLSLISTVVVALTAAAIVFFNLFPVFTREQVTKAEQNESESDQTVKSEEQELEVNNHIREFISTMHDFYNETTGYGSIEELDWGKQVKQAEKINTIIKSELPDVNDETLQHDLTYIHKQAKAVTEGQETENVQELHRMFHDLDIALNHYNGYDKIWNVTETLEKPKNRE